MNLNVSYGNGGNKLFLIVFVSWSPLSSRYNGARVVRESATYAELAGLMGPADRELMDEDDTQSFEALELRLKTPIRPVPKSRVGASTTLKPVLKSRMDSRVGSKSKGTNETCPQVQGKFQNTLLSSQGWIPA
jgi:hypothetical protein